MSVDPDAFGGLEALRSHMHHAARAFQAKHNIPEQDFEDIAQEAMLWALSGPAWVRESWEVRDDPVDQLATDVLAHLQRRYPDGIV